MPDSIDIRSLPEGGVYQLFLPDQVASMLQLKEDDGNPLSIIHKNKMQLEWLGQTILKQYNTLNEAFIAGTAKLKRKKRVAIIVLALSALIAFLSSNIATLTKINILYVRVFAFTVGIICCLQLLKYIAQGLTNADKSLDFRILELKELILKDYSMEDWS